MKISKFIYLSLFVLFCAVLAGVSYEQMVDARPYHNNQGNAAGNGNIVGTKGGAKAGSVATGGARSRTIAGLPYRARAGSASNHSIDDYNDGFDYDSDECEYCD